MTPSHPFLRSFGYAGRGVWHALRYQRNFRVHVSIGLAAASMAWLLRFSRLDWGLLIVAMALVMALELINTGVEALVDLASPGYHRLAAAAKDAAAGGVLVAAGASVAMGLVVYGPRLAHVARYFMVRWHQNPAVFVAWCAGLVAAYVVLWVVVPGRPQREGGQNRIGGTP